MNKEIDAIIRKVIDAFGTKTGERPFGYKRYEFSSPNGIYIRHFRSAHKRDENILCYDRLFVYRTHEDFPISYKDRTEEWKKLLENLSLEAEKQKDSLP